MGCLAQACVVGDEATEVTAELERGGEVDRVEQAKLRGQQRARGSEDPIADPDQLDPGKHLPASPDRLLAERQQRARYLCSGERARNESPSTAEVAAQRRRLRFGYRELDDRRRVEVGRSLSGHRAAA